MAIKNSTWRTVAVGLPVLTVVLFVVILLLGGKSPKKTAADSVKAIKTAPIIYKVGKEKTLYHFDEGKKGCISVYLGSDAEFYPKGGSVIITPPFGSGKPWEDEPGTIHQREPVNPGTFTVCRKSPNAWGVEIWQ